MHDRIAWVAYGVMVLGVPFAVLVFRLHMQAWHYYLAGGVCVACGLLICAMDFAGTTAREKALRALQQPAP